MTMVFFIARDLLSRSQGWGGQRGDKGQGHSTRNREARCFFLVTFSSLSCSSSSTCLAPTGPPLWTQLAQSSPHSELDSLGLWGLTCKLPLKTTVSSQSCYQMLVNRGATLWVVTVPRDDWVRDLFSFLVLLGGGGHLKQWSVMGLSEHFGTSLWKGRAGPWSLLSCFLAVKFLL